MLNNLLHQQTKGQIPQGILQTRKNKVFKASLIMKWDSLQSYGICILYNILNSITQLQNSNSYSPKGGEAFFH